MRRSHRQKYPPLDQHRREIRMFVLAGSARASRIRGKLIHVDLDNLDNAPFEFYEALSYTWGDVTDTVPANVNGLDHPITRNLDAALRSLRGRTRPRYMWIDALCINQEDLDERARQVRLMRFIFQRAIQVLVWLGPPGYDAEEALKLLEHITDFDTPDDIVFQTLLAPEHRSKWEAVIRFFDRPWFFRVWIRQEVACAREVIVLCGRESRLKIKWKTLVNACEMIFRYIGEFESIATALKTRTPGLRHVIHIDTMHEHIEQGKYVDLQDLLLYARGTEATDPRDRVYGLLGLGGPKVDDIEINYLLPPQEVYKTATVSLLKSSQSLFQLSGCQWSNSNPKWPSWVMPLDVDFESLPLRNNEEGDQLYHAAGDSKASILFENSDTELLVNGYILDHVHEVAGVFRNIDPPVYATVLREWLSLIQRIIKQRHHRTSEHEILTILCRTLIADQDFEGDRASQSFCERYSKCSSIDKFPEMFGTLIIEEGDPYITCVNTRCALRRLVGTKSGCFGLAGASCLPDDLVCILLGSGVPFILRPEGNGYILIGEAYIDGIMDGEAFRTLQQQGAGLTTFRIK